MRPTSLMRQPRGRLVEQQHLGFERERGGDLQRALAAVGQLDDDGVGMPIKPDVDSSSASARVRRTAPQQRFPSARKSKLAPRARCSARRTFSSAVRCGNTAEIWNCARGRAAPRRPASCW
jgi:hypothetical protein